ncbi:butyrophilin-like protein 2 isoform X10 [Scomber scombrus]|uniref:Butyrophilin-like protein 2 isoform X10 n=1 Tax=Scomber scombrus TaxID=13677 RepID=A0AAV1PXH8_SCOSC
MCFCLPEKIDITVKEGSDVMLPCSFNTTDITLEKFEWKKDGRQVFLYDDRSTSKPHEQFRGRVEHFPNKLKSGDASITIRNTKVADRGLYTCAFPKQKQHIFLIQLYVGSAPKPSIQHLKPKNNREALLQCETHGDPQPELRWQDSEGNNLPAEEPQVSTQGDQFYVTLQITVKKTGVYRCVATQKDISHQIYEKTYVEIPGEILFSSRLTAGQGIVIAVGVIVAAVLVFVVYKWMYRIKSCFRNGTTAPNPSGNGLPQNPNETDGGAVDETGSQLIPSNGNQPTNEDSRV